MCFEIIAAQLITPYFGSSVFIWGSTLSVFLAALGVGYAVGGRLSLRRESRGTLAALFALAGVFVVIPAAAAKPLADFLVGVAVHDVLRYLSPLATALAMFFLPACLLGMTLPIAVQAAAISEDAGGAGRSVGVLYSLNAAGSLLGAFAVTFLLAAFFGSRSILYGCGALLLLTSILVAAFIPEAKHSVATTGSEDPGARVSLGLRIFVFLCGVVVMGLEVVGGAQIAPYLGSSVMLWGSLICVFLMAMGTGYRIGGFFADAGASRRLLSVTVVAGGLWLLMAPFGIPALGNAAQDAVTGTIVDWLLPLPIAFIIFFFPVMCFSIVAPVAVGLTAGRREQTGSAAGKLYALSTTGNVAGLLAATFFLIPAAGSTGLLTWAGAASSAGGLTFFYAGAGFQKIKARYIAVSALTLTAAAFFVFLPKPEKIPLVYANEVAAGSAGSWKVVQMREHRDYAVLRRIRYQMESPYQHVAVIDEKQYPVGTPLVLDDGRMLPALFTTAFGNERILRFDRYLQSAVALNDDGETIRLPLQSSLSYTDLIHIPMLINPAIKNVLIVGGGGGVIATVLKNCYDLSVDVVEIDPVVILAATQWFGLKPDGRLHVYREDGRTFVHRCRRSYDLIFLDAYSAGGRIPFHLTTREFMEDVKARLTPRGMVYMNIIGAIEGRRSKPFRSILKTVRDVFGQRSVFVCPVSLAPLGARTDVINLQLGAVSSAFGPTPSREDVLRKLAQSPSLRDIAGKAADHAQRMLTADETEAIEQNDVPVLTDDYAPVDLLNISTGR